MWKVIIEDPEGQRVDVELKADEYLFGRGPLNKVRLTDWNVSRRHARFARVGASFVLEDLGSLNGTYVNGVPVVGQAPLQHGDHIQIGDYRIVILQEATEPTLSALSDPVAEGWLTGRPPRLVMLAGPTPGAEFPLSKPRMVIGRGDGADVLVDHKAVSRRHCEIVALEAGRFEIIDLGSANGLLINGQELRRAILDAGDVVVLGDEVTLKYVAAGETLRPGPNDLRPIRPPPASSVTFAKLLPVVLFVSIVVAGSGVILLWYLGQR